ncbi:MAG: putative conserved protein YecE [Verrucomicrobia bacterium]|nr:MAG: putative conserved protein YecE [Verrucomicrobiota bacterium]
MGDLRLGTQGWNYAAWVGPMYPAATKPTAFLETYARAFTTVEVDSTFYAIPPAKTVRNWAKRVGADFQFALKLPQQITHEQRLIGAGDLAARFFDVARELGNKLGPILIQLGPDFSPDELPSLAKFLPTLPGDLKFAVEFRQKGWIQEEVIALLEQHGVALTLVDARWIPRETMLRLADRPTADFAYVRWMGPNRDITDYSRLQFDRTAELERWAAALPALLAKVVTVYGYVNNHYAGHSPANVRMLQTMLGQVSVDPAQLGEQLGLF